MSIGIRRKGQMKRFEVSLPEDLELRFTSLIYDRINHRPIFGLRSQIVTDLIKAWTEEREAELALAARQQQEIGHA